MKNLQPNEKHLADKLQHVPVPDVDQSWEQMRKLLDREMPKAGAGWGGNSKWWWMGITAGFIILSTWLVHSLTNSDNRIAEKKQLENRNTSSTNKDNTAATKDDKTTSLNSADNSENNKQESSNNTNPVSASSNNQTAGSVSKTANKKVDNDVTILVDKNVNQPSVNKQKASEVKNDTPDGDTRKNNKNKVSENGRASSPIITGGSGIYASTGRKNDRDLNKNNKNSTTNQIQPKNNQLKPGIANSVIPGEHVNTIADKNSLKNQIATEQNKNSSTEDEITIDASLVNSDLMLQEKSISPSALFNTAETAERAANIIPGKTDRAFLREMRKKGMKEDNRKMSKSGMSGKSGGTERELTFAAGLALPQNVAIGRQQASSYNINARNNLLLDYLPAPYFQYHLNTKLFLQTEFHFQSPQYTERLLLSKYTYTFGSTRQENNNYLEKLYYFNIPFNVYYSPARNFYIGGGLQYSSLLGGVTTWEEKTTEGQNVLSYRSTTTRFKDDSLTTGFSPSEWRYQFDANYYFKRFTMGLRFNQAMKDYMNRNGSVPGVPALRERNQSFLLYLRFNIWEERKKEAN